MTVKNYVLDINKTSLQHPSIVLRQDDYNIYTINISVTENGTPVDLGSYTLNFLGITPAGAKIIDSKNFITNAGDLKNGKFSYRFPKEAAGSKGVYDVAYFRLKTTSGATSTIDLNLRVLGGIDLTADEVKDYITVDDTLRNTLISEVFKKVDAKVDEHLATVVKGDKGDKGDPGKDGYMPIIGGRNYILNSERTLSGSGNISDTGWVNTSIPISAFSNKTFVISVQVDYDNLTAVSGNGRLGFEVSMNYFLPDGSKKVRAVGAWRKAVVGESFHGRVHATFDMSGDTFDGINASNHFEQGFYIQGVTGTNISVSNPKLEIGNVFTDWTPAPEDVPSNDAQLVHKIGNETIAGDKTFTGTLVANNPIRGILSIAMLDQKDLNSATVTGKYKIDSTYSNTPSQMPNGAFIDVLNFDNSLIYQVIVARDISDTIHKSTMWVRMRLSDGWGDWQSISKDDNVLHNSGNETVGGDKTFTSNTTLATTTILAGNYGLRVTSSGFQKTTDGKTWVSANI